MAVETLKLLFRIYHELAFRKRTLAAVWSLMRRCDSMTDAPAL